LVAFAATKKYPSKQVWQLSAAVVQVAQVEEHKAQVLSDLMKEVVLHDVQLVVVTLQVSQFELQTVVQVAERRSRS